MSKVFGIVGSLVIFGTLILFGIIRFRMGKVSFLRLFGFIFIIAMMWKVIDLLLMDWLIICTITPKWVVIEGTEGCRGYKDYMYHFKGFLIGCVYTTVMAMMIAWVDYLILRFLIWI